MGGLGQSSRSDLEHYLLRYLDGQANIEVGKGDGVVVTLLDLIAHKNPRLRVLELGEEDENKRKQWLDTLGHKSSLPRFREWYVGNFVGTDMTVGRMTKSGDLESVPFDTTSTASYDVILLLNACTSLLNSRYRR